MSRFSEMLKYLRKREDYSQEELAKKIQISPSAISMYEQGRRQPDFETEEKLADLFNVALTSAVFMRFFGRSRNLNMTERAIKYRYVPHLCPMKISIKISPRTSPRACCKSGDIVNSYIHAWFI